MTGLRMTFLLMTILPVLSAGGQGDPVPIDKLADATIHVDGYPDFLEIGYGSVWVTNEGSGSVRPQSRPASLGNSPAASTGSSCSVARARPSAREERSGKRRVA